MAEAFTKITKKQIVKNHYPYLKELDYVMQHAFNCSRDCNIKKLLKEVVKKIKKYQSCRLEQDSLSALERNFLKIITSKIIYINNNIIKNDNASMFETFSMETSHILGSIINSFELYNNTSSSIKQDLGAIKKLKSHYKHALKKLHRAIYKLNFYNKKTREQIYNFKASDKEDIANLTSNIINYLQTILDLEKQILDLHKRIRGTKIHFWSNVGNMLGNVGTADNLKHINQKVKKLKNEVKALDNRFKKNTMITEEINKKLKDIMSEEFKTALNESSDKHDSDALQSHFEALKLLEDKIPQLKTKLYN